MIETLAPRLLISRPIEAVVIPLPTDDATPPVTKMYFGMFLSPAFSFQHSAVSNRVTGTPRFSREERHPGLARFLARPTPQALHQAKEATLVRRLLSESFRWPLARGANSARVRRRVRVADS